MSHKATKRFQECVQFLRDSGRFNSYKLIADVIDIHPQCLSDILKNKRKVTSNILEQSVQHLHLNPVFLLSGEGNMICWDELTELQTPEEASGDLLNEITYVPVAAQAGYIEQFQNPVYEEELPSFTLPKQKFLSGTLRCFDVAGDSMEPTLFDGDKIICRKIESDMWAHNIRTNFVYVLITTEGVVVKRLENHLKDSDYILLNSDNDFYETVKLQAEQIIEVWTVVMRINHFRPAATLDQVKLAKELELVKQSMQEQQETIQLLNSTIAQIANRN